MNFGYALECMRHGGKCGREAWDNDAKVSIVDIPGVSGGAFVLDSCGVRQLWGLHYSALLADDWFLFDEDGRRA